MGRTSDSKRLLIENAIDLIHSRSYTAVSIEDICRLADVRKGSFHYFFRTKRELALAAIDYQWERTKELLEKAFASDLPPLERLSRFVDTIYIYQCSIKDSSEQMYGCPFGNLASELSTQDDVIRHRISEVLDGHVEYISRAVQEAIDIGDLPINIDANATGKSILAFMEGLILLGKSTNDPDIMKRLGDNIIRLAINKE